jgi:hypothetical protein
MGPNELQLLREFAIECVRGCAEGVLHGEADAATDITWYRAWFEHRYDDWASRSRQELDGRTPAQVMLDERRSLAGGRELLALPPQQLELYTDLPAEDHADITLSLDDTQTADVADGPSVPWLEQSHGATTLDDDRTAGRRGLPDATWSAFCNRYLADWFDA